MTRTRYENLYVLRDTFDATLRDVAPSIAVFAASANIPRSTMGHIRRVGTARKTTAERVAAHYAELTGTALDVALAALFAPLSRSRQKFMRQASGEEPAAVPAIGLSTNVPSEQINVAQMSDSKELINEPILA